MDSFGGGVGGWVAGGIGDGGFWMKIMGNLCLKIRGELTMKINVVIFKYKECLY